MTTSAAGKTTSSNWLFDEIADIVSERETQVWRDRAACKGMDPALFFPGRGECAPEADAACARCPVADPCLEYAISKPFTNMLGVWGGTSVNARRKMKEARVAA